MKKERIYLLVILSVIVIGLIILVESTKTNETTLSSSVSSTTTTTIDISNCQSSIDQWVVAMGTDANRSSARLAWVQIVGMQSPLYQPVVNYANQLLQRSFQVGAYNAGRELGPVITQQCSLWTREGVTIPDPPGTT